jgi:hypothetical protein
MLCGLAAVAGAAQSAAVLWVVGVEVLLDELAPAERVVVGVHARRVLAEDAHGIAGEDAGPEPALVLASVAALPGGTASQFGLASVVLAASAVGVLGAAGHGADGECSASGHVGHLGSMVGALLRGRHVVELEKPTGPDPVLVKRYGRVFAVVAGSVVVLSALYGWASGGDPKQASQVADRSRSVRQGDVQPWPFTVDSGTLRCRNSILVTFESPDGTEYGLNGSARNVGYPGAEPIWAADPALGNGLKVDIGPMIAEGNALC